MSNFDEVFNVNSLTLNVTNQCQLNCEYCFEENKTAEYMSEEDAVTIFEKAYRNFKKTHSNWEDKFSVAFFGGEPFLNFEAIKAVMKHAYDNNYLDVSFGVTTNLVTLSSDMIETISKYELGIMISIDGLKEIHDKNRCNSYDAVVSNIRKLQEAGLNYLLSARMTFTPSTVSSMYYGVVNLIENVGIDVIHPYIVTDMEWTPGEMDILKREWGKLFDLQIRYFNLESSKRNASITPIIGALTTFYSFNYDNIPCPFGDTTCLCVGCGGEIQPCHQRFTKTNLREELRLGNILNDEIITKRFMGRIEPYSWTPMDANFDCSTCEAFPICRGCCPSEGIDVRDSFLGVPSIICFQNNVMMSLINERGNELLKAGNIRNTGIHAINLNLEIVDKVIDLRKTELSDPILAIKLSNLLTSITENKKFMFPVTKTLVAEQIEVLSHFIGKEVKIDDSIR